MRQIDPPEQHPPLPPPTRPPAPGPRPIPGRPNWVADNNGVPRYVEPIRPPQVAP